MWSDVVLFLTLTGMLAQEHRAPDVPPHLAAMAAAERAFAASARELGVRDAFLKFLTADAVMFLPDPVVARAGLANRPSVPFADEPLTWEPLLGDIAASGELGWLTGRRPGPLRMDPIGTLGTRTTCQSGSGNRSIAPIPIYEGRDELGKTL